MKFGYACINLTVPTKFRTCRLKTVEEKGLEYVKELTLSNFTQTLDAVRWNIQHDILFYRLSSDLVPFATHSVNDWEWWNDPDVLAITEEIKLLQETYDLRLSAHPGQYNVLNSPNPSVIKNTMNDLDYHAKMLTAVNGQDMILHIGGVYGDKELAIKRFAENYTLLSDDVKSLLRIENDDKSFTLKDVIHVHKLTGAPICFDIHHHNCNHGEDRLEEMLPEVWSSWGSKKPKCHISSGKNHSQDRSHHNLILEDDLLALLSLIGEREADVMFEAKLKEQSVLPHLHLQKI
ncbi:UV DNA damage repair endonuclease UvsE [Jeotgalibacillus sp. S-D1]|uniref:UV DNA damage repair endonuclease UvsE n=1 Tax=Jeotgalibacillus sp. S-D1 TaxID=2552189 RepID=UPI00105A56B6|nr:UV DNA damage repair endonuclease UvsE [Jeotgalibacillus sp. S-D1]TDL35278.1 UV DNA damage repair endonuclease UvsE [Jeotgalibacillus sp. S-D1]